MIHALHHLNLRKRASAIGKKLEPYPSDKKLVRAVDHLVLIMSFIGPFSTLPQVIAAWKTDDIASLSLYTWMFWLGLSIIWITYGVVHKSVPIIITSSLNSGFQFAVLLAIIIRV